MNVQFYCPYWGSEYLPFNDFLQKVKESGYTGVEMSLPLIPEEKAAIIDQLAAHELLLIGQHWETTDQDFNTHCQNFEKRLRNLAVAKPQFINSQTGKDYFSFAHNKTLLQLAQKVSTETGVPIVHETHRGKFSFAAHITRLFLDDMPDLRLTLDISHWCNVAESFLSDQEENVEAAIRCAAHIHSRVGYTQGPQVNDPRAPEWQEALAVHLNWWDRIIAQQQNQGATTFTITTEFGPPPYLPVFPYTGQPVADQWEINVFMKKLLDARYNKLT